MVVMSVLLEQAKGGHGAVQVGQDRNGPVAAGSHQVTPTTDRANISHPVDGSLTRQQVRAGRYQSQTRRKTPTASIPAASPPRLTWSIEVDNNTFSGSAHRHRPPFDPSRRPALHERGAHRRRSMSVSGILAGPRCLRLSVCGRHRPGGYADVVCLRAAYIWIRAMNTISGDHGPDLRRLL